MDKSKLYLVMNIGCIECGVSSKPALVTRDKQKAERLAEFLDQKFSWREGGQNRFEVFELLPEEMIDPEYREVIDAQASAETSAPALPAPKCA